jgi:hypothetical protein
MRLLTLLLCLLSAPLAAAPPRRERLPPGLVIASIKIETHNVFDTDKGPEDKLIYRLADRVHIKTWDYVIERELLFAVGEPYDAALIEETERNLRGLGFIRRAEISATVNAQGAVDVVVRTYDSWTLEVVAGFKRAGGQTGIKAGLAEHNIMGQGKSGSAVYSRDGTSASEALTYKDPQFLHYKRFEYSMIAARSPGSQYYQIGLNRPFYASIARRAAGVTTSYAAAKVGDYTRRTGEIGLNYGIALATSTERTRRVNFGILSHRAKSDGPVPDLEQLTFLKAGIEWEELDFLTVRRIQNFTHDEDYNLGLGFTPTIAWAPKVAAIGTSQEQIIPRIDVHKGYTWANQLLLMKSGYGSKYINGHNGNRVASVDASYYLRQFRFQTLAFHTGVAMGWMLDGNNQLRGYGLSEFAGSKSVLFNVEDRIYVYDDFLRVMDVGAVVFADSGYVWPAAAGTKLRDLKNSVGMGLRVAPSRSGSNSPVRVDVAFPLNRQGGGSRYAISILAGQAF